MLRYQYSYFKKLYDDNYSRVTFDKTVKQRIDRFYRIGKMIHTGDRVLDFGGGDGELKKYLPSVEYNILDLSDEHDFKKKNRITLKNDVYIDSPSKSYDVAVLSEILEHIPNCYETLGEVNRVLRDQGRVIISLPNPFSFPYILRSFMGKYQDPSKEHLYWFDWSYLTNLLESAGFELVSKTTFCFLPSRIYQKVYFLDGIFSKIFPYNCGQLLCEFKKKNQLSNVSPIIPSKNKTDYKKLFEGKFTKTYKYNMSLPEKIYYNFSPSTYNEKKLFSLLNVYAKGKKNLILDIGCGGGHYQLVQYGKVYGVDISKASLKNAEKIYHEVKEADVSRKIPYPDKTFDIVFCSEVFGHIDKEHKERFLDELNRVIKDNGFICFSIETLGDNLLTKYLKKKNLYEEYWINYQGHIGLENPSVTKNRFESHFKSVLSKKTSSHILPIDGYLIFSDKLPFLKIFQNNILRRITNMLLFPLFYLVLAVSKFDSANDIIIVAKKSR